MTYSQPFDIASLYELLFNRKADQGGVDYWQSRNLHPLRLQSQMAAYASPDDFNAYLAGNADNNDPIATYYRDLFGRDPDQEGYQYWLSQTDTLGTGNPLREAMIGAAHPTDAAYFGNRNISENDWAAYRQRATQQEQGMNAMPFVFSNYGALAGQTPEHNMSMLYRTNNGGLGGLGGAQTTQNTQGR